MGAPGLVHHVHVKLDWQVLRGKAGVVAAGLIVELAVNGKVSCARRSRGTHPGFDDEIACVDVQFLARIEWEADVLSGWIADDPGGEIGGHIELERSGNQQFRFGLV